MTKSLRLRRTKSQMYPLLEQYERSTVQLSVFCAEHSVSEHVFKYWRSRYRSEHALGVTLGLGDFQEILAPASTDSGEACFVRLRDSRGTELFFERGVSAAYLKSLLSW